MEREGERKIRGYLVSVRRPAGFAIRHQKMTSPFILCGFAIRINHLIYLLFLMISSAFSFSLSKLNTL